MKPHEALPRCSAIDNSRVARRMKLARGTPAAAAQFAMRCRNATACPPHRPWVSKTNGTHSTPRDVRRLYRPPPGRFCRRRLSRDLGSQPSRPRAAHAHAGATCAQPIAGPSSRPRCAASGGRQRSSTPATCRASRPPRATYRYLQKYIQQKESRGLIKQGPFGDWKGIPGQILRPTFCKIR